MQKEVPVTWRGLSVQRIEIMFPKAVKL